MGDWFGGREIGDLDGELKERYAAERKRYVMKKIDGKRIVVKTDEPAPIAAYRELKMLAAAINRFFKKKVGGVWTRFSPVLPAAPEARERWLSRYDADKSIIMALRKRRDSCIPGTPGCHSPSACNRTSSPPSVSAAPFTMSSTAAASRTSHCTHDTPSGSAGGVGW